MKESKSNGLEDIISQAIEEMKSEQGNNFSLERINLAELERRTGVSRAKLRRFKANNFNQKAHGLVGQKQQTTVLSGYSAYLDKLLRQGITNSAVCLDRLHEFGFEGSLSTVKRYIKAHKHLVPAKRQLVAPRGNRGRRFTTEPGEAYQMDWGFTKVLDYDGTEYTAACFAMVCHHCGQRYVEFFPNAKQENLFIGMIHAFGYMGIPKYVLTDNMKSVVLHRDFEGHPVWQKDYEAFMKTVGFQTKLCKPRHPFTKGKVERLVRFVKENFLVGRIFWNITDLNRAALAWCNQQNSTYHKATAGVPQELHYSNCAEQIRMLEMDPALLFYLCPERKISFDGFVNYEGRRFGVPFSYHGSTARVMRKDDMIYIYSADLKQQLTTHDVTWSKRDRFCKDQYAALEQPEEFPTMPVKAEIVRLPEPESSLSFEKFNFDFSVIKGRDAAKLKTLPSLSAIYAHRNLAFIGPAGTGKTHLAQAFGYECCQRGIKTYFIKMSELRDKFTAARRAGKEASVLDGLVRPSCLIIDEVGHCEFDKENTRLFFDLIDRRYNKEGNFNIVFTSNKHPSHWRTNFNEDDALLCALDRIFDDATVFNIKGESFRGKRLETVALQTSRVKAPASSETPTP